MSALGTGTKSKFGVRKLLEVLMPDDGASTNFCAFWVCLSGSCRVHAACEEKQQTGSASYWAGRVKYQRSLHRGAQPYSALLWWSSPEVNLLTADIQLLSTEPLPSGNTITVFWMTTTLYLSLSKSLLIPLLDNVSLRLVGHPITAWEHSQNHLPTALLWIPSLSPRHLKRLLPTFGGLC